MSSAPEGSAARLLLAKLARLEAVGRSFWERFSRNQRLAVVAALLVLAGLAYWMPGGGSGELRLVFRHDLDSAEVSVRIDGKEAYSQHLAGSVRRRLPFFDKTASTAVKTLTVAAGSHEVEVQVQSGDGEYDQSRHCEVTVPRGQQATLVVSSLRGGMGLVFQGAPIAPSGSSDDSSGYVRSILVTVVGSAVSAAIGFMVQEALGKRKSRAPAAVPAVKEMAEDVVEKA